MWFEGEVVEAITKAKDGNILFIVLAYDESPQSALMMSHFMNPEVVDVTSDVVAIKVLKGTNDFQNLTQMYPLERIPAVVLINPSNGKSIDIAYDIKFAEDLAEKVTLAQSLMGRKGTTQDGSKATSSRFAEMTEEEKKQEIKRLRELAAQKLKEKEKEKDKDTQEREMLRRKETAELMRIKQETEQKKILEHLEKQKREDEEARKRIKEQIARDKEIKAREREREKEKLKQTQNENTAPPTSSSTSVNQSSHSRLVIRLTNGETLKAEFPNNTTLKTVRNYIKENQPQLSNQYVFSTNFPNRTFSLKEESLTLSEIGLVPSGTLILKQSTAQTSNEFFFSNFLAYFWGFLNYFTSFFKPKNPTPAINQSQPQSQPQSQSQSQPSSSQRTRPLGNVRSLSDPKEENDQKKKDDTYYNGNSTQFM